METLFRLQENETSVKTEVLAGVATFLATMYIIVVNPSILSNADMSFNGVLTATILVSAFSSIAMGLYANNPIVLAPGMGLNAFFAFSVILGMGVDWQTALGAVFWSGIIFLILSIFNVRTAIVKAIPRQLRYGVACGIGLFIAMIGVMDAHFIVSDETTIVTMGTLDAVTITFLVGLAVSSIFVIRKVPAALILGIIVTTLLSIPIGRWYGNASEITQGTATLVTWKGFFAPPDFSVFLQMDFLGSLKLSVWPVIFAFLFTDMFDSLSTFIGVAEAADLKDDSGEPRNIKQSLIVDGFSTTISGLFGTSAGTSYIESATGIEQGGRTGLTAVTAGILFLPFLFFSPLLSIVPTVATSPVLVLVGVFMMKPALRIKWTQFDDAIPAFLAMFLIPLTYSITQGIVWGFLSWTVVKLATGRANEVSPMLYVIDAFAILALIV